MFRCLLAALIALASVPACAAPQLATLTVKVEKVSPRGGDVRVALYTEQTWSDDNAKDINDSVSPPGPARYRHARRHQAVCAVKLFQVSTATAGST